MNYLTLVDKLNKAISNIVASSKKRKNISLWQIVLVAISGAIIFYIGSLLVPYVNQHLQDKEISTNFKIVISKIEVEKGIYEGADGATLNKGPSHFPGTALPSDAEGNVVIFGHSAKTKEHDDPFGRLDELEKGDEIKLIYKKEEYKYQVTEKKTVESTDTSVIDPTKKSILTLITCIKPDYPKEKRLIVMAEKI